MPATDADRKLNAILQKLLAGKNIHHAVMAVQSGDSRLDWAGAGGHADAEGTTPMQVDTPYVIASVTKIYTSAVVMHLRAQGKLALEDALPKHLPESLIRGIHVYKGEDYSLRLTVEDLLTHRSGVADYYEEKVPGRGNILDRLLNEGDFAWTAEDVMALVRDHLKPHFRPGEGNKAHYSDTNYELLGRIIESVTDKPLAQVYDEVIFVPLGLRRTYLYRTGKQKTLMPAPIYYGDRPLQIPQALGSVGPHGGIVSTAPETIAFLKAFFGGRFFPQDYLAGMQQWRKIFFPLQYGHGLMRYKLPWVFAPFQKRT